VIGAATLEQGEAWCEEVLGITPQPGGQHPLMGTHNRLFSLASPEFPRAYGEVIAVDPMAPAPGRPRWFDLDHPATRAQLVSSPVLLHWAASSEGLDGHLVRLRELGHDPGELLTVERNTPTGMLRWRISVRSDGHRLCEGALPTFIEWGATHPGDSLPDQGLRLQGLSLARLPSAVIAALPVTAPLSLSSSVDAPAVVARLSTPRGPVTLRSA
jgi:hypothetical protein